MLLDKIIDYRFRAAPSKRDIQRLAMLPGKRISRTGHTYYETRVNRSDTAEERKTHGVKTIAGLRAALKPYETKYGTSITSGFTR